MRCTSGRHGENWQSPPAAASQPNHGIVQISAMSDHTRIKHFAFGCYELYRRGSTFQKVVAPWALLASFAVSSGCTASLATGRLLHPATAALHISPRRAMRAKKGQNQFRASRDEGSVIHSVWCCGSSNCLIFHTFAIYCTFAKYSVYPSSSCAINIMHAA